MIEALSRNRSLLAPNLLRAQHNNGKLSVPVEPYVARYIRFKHIVGVPTANGSAGVPVAQLRMVDIMIDNLITRQTETPAARTEKATPAVLKNADKGIYVNTWA